MLNRMQLPGKMSGFGLAEILIAMVIGIFLMAGMTKVFMGSKKAYLTQEAMARVQESGRFAMEMLGRDIRMGGYQGCGNLARIVPNVIAKNVPGSGAFGNSDAIRGYEYDGANFSPPYGDSSITTDDPVNVVTDTDVISISRADDCGAYLVGNMSTMNANVQINGDNSCNFSAGDLILITDCASSDLFRATNVSMGGSITIAHAQSVNGNTANFLSKAYGEDARIYRFVMRDFFIRNNPFGEPALYRRDNGGTSQELVEGVSDMQNLYGEDTSADLYVDRYLEAHNGTPANLTDDPDWEKVGSVRLNLELTSVRQVVSVDATAASKEKRGELIQNMTTTISIRNRLP